MPDMTCMYPPPHMYPPPYTGEHVSVCRRANWGSVSVAVSQLVHMHLVTCVSATHCACTAVIASLMPERGVGKGGGKGKGEGDGKEERVRDRMRVAESVH